MRLRKRPLKAASWWVNRRIARAALLALAGAALLPARMALAAGAATANLDVTAKVVQSCTVTTTPVNFGVYDPTQAGDTQVTGTITLTCASGTTPVVALSNGQFSASVGQTKQGVTTPAVTSSGLTITRAMNNNATFLGYDLFTNATYTTIWNATNTVSPGQIGSAQPVSLTVYGDIPQKQTQTLAGGTFRDTVVVTVTF